MVKSTESKRKRQGVNRASDIRIHPMDGGISFRLDIQPRHLRTNLRYKFSHALPEDALQAMADAEESARHVLRETGWHPGTQYVGFEMVTFVNNRAIDIDSCHKRTQDAVSIGLGFDDSRINQVLLGREISDDEHIYVSVWRNAALPGERLPDSWQGREPEWDWDGAEDDVGEFDR